MNNTKDLTISLISHNSKGDLSLLLPSLYDAIKNIDSEVLLVDNCSNDSTVSFLNENYSDIRITENEERLGYGANHNKNLSLARGKYIVLMNSDMVVAPGIFDELMQFMEKNDDVGIVTPNVLNEDGSLQHLNKRYPTVADLFIRRFVPDRVKPVFKNRLDKYEMKDVGYNDIVDVPFLSGAFMFTRTDLIKELNGFDERFFLYFEDVDLCRRVQESHRTVYFPYARVTHRWERAAHKDLKWASVFMVSALKYFNKWGYRFF